jgi:hypothetical protein
MKKSIVITGCIIAILGIIGACIVVWLQPPQAGVDSFLPLCTMLAILGAIYPIAYRNGFNDATKEVKQ